MKKLIRFLCITFALTGCGSTESGVDTGLNNGTSVNAVLQQATNDIPAVGDILQNFGDGAINGTDPKFAELDDIEVDIDFTGLSTTMAYAQLSNMMYPYQDYLGQTVKIQGEYYLAEVPQNNANYHFLLLMDDTNCCQGVMEFVLPEGSEYPKMGQQIRIAGEYILDVDDTGEYPVLDVSNYVF